MFLTLLINENQRVIFFFTWYQRTFLATPYFQLALLFRSLVFNRHPSSPTNLLLQIFLRRTLSRGSSPTDLLCVQRTFSHGSFSVIPSSMDLLQRPFSHKPSPTDLLPRTFSHGPSPANLIRRTFSHGPSPTYLLHQTFSVEPSPADLLPAFFQQTFSVVYLFRQSTCRPSFGYINSSCSQFRRHTLRWCLTPVKSTQHVVNFGDFSNNPISTYRIQYMSNKFDALGLSTYVTHLTYMLHLAGEC